MSCEGSVSSTPRWADDAVLTRRCIFFFSPWRRTQNEEAAEKKKGPTPLCRGWNILESAVRRKWMHLSSMANNRGLPCGDEAGNNFGRFIYRSDHSRGKVPPPSSGLVGAGVPVWHDRDHSRRLGAINAGL